jgi:hypothetical protein
MTRSDGVRGYRGVLAMHAISNAFFTQIEIVQTNRWDKGPEPASVDPKTKAPCHYGYQGGHKKRFDAVRF